MENFYVRKSCLFWYFSQLLQGNYLREKRTILDLPTGCATSCTSQAKRLQGVLHSIHNGDTHWNVSCIASKHREKRGELLEVNN